MSTHAVLVPLADISGSSFILLGVLVVFVWGIGYALYTRQGSGINKHPSEDADDPVLGDETKMDDDDEPEDERAGIDQSEGSPMDQRGVQ